MPNITTTDVAAKLSEHVIDKLLAVSHLLLGSAGTITEDDKTVLRQCVDAEVITPAEYAYVTQDEYPVSQAPFATPELTKSDLQMMVDALAAVEVSVGGSPIHSLRLKLQRILGDDDETTECVVEYQWQAARELYEGGAAFEMLRRVTEHINGFELPGTKLLTNVMLAGDDGPAIDHDDMREQLREYVKHLTRTTNDWTAFEAHTVE